nr:unnamed protein product [Spirometra erinaceieuropaei]
MRVTADALDPVFLNYNKNEPIWITNQRHGKRSCVFFWPGSNNAYAGKYPFATFGLYSDDPTFEYRIDRIMDWITRDEFNFCAFYFNEPDHTGHEHGPDSKEVLDVIELVNKGIAYLLKRIKESPALNGKVNLIVTADHGMAQIPLENRIELWHFLKYNVHYFGNNSPGLVGLWPKGTMRGNHGYDNEDPLMHPFMVASGPDIEVLQGIQHFEQIDIYPFVCGLLGLQRPNRIDGRIERVIKFMKTKPSEDFIRIFKKYETGIMSDN